MSKTTPIYGINLPIAWVLLAALLLPAVLIAQQPGSCCSIAKNKGQQAFDKKDYATAISHWTKGKGCPDAKAKCPDLDALIKKAKDAQAAAAKPKPVTPAPKPQPKPTGPTEAERQAQAADQAAKAAFDIAKDTNTPQSYQSFLNRHSSSRYAAEARRLQKVLEDAAKPKPVQTPATTPNEPNLPSAIQKLEADMVRVAGGSFTMGCKDAQRDGSCDDDEKPAHTVRVSDFSIGKYEVTQAQWRAVMGSDPPELYNKGCDQCPVERVSWNDIQEFLTKLNNLTGKRYRLPTEAEWEYAARGGAQSRGYLYSGSNTLSDVAWYDANAKSGNTHGEQKTTRPVGTKNSNELGLYDMSGNVWEWCEDDWHDNYRGAPTDGRAWVDSSRGSNRVRRGGSWPNTARFCRAASRNYGTPAYRNDNLGFRLAL